MTGLEELGLPGPANVREVLSSDETLSAIEEFQVSNGILLPSLQPALPLLDLHGIPRLEFHQSVLDEMKERLIMRIKEIAAESENPNRYKLLNDLLLKCMPIIKIKILRPVVLCLMQHLPQINAEHLSVVVTNKEYYEEAAVEVKQQIWENDQSLFGDEVSPLLTAYIDLKESQLTMLDSPQPVFFQSLPKVRRQCGPVQELVQMVGKKTHLYEMVLQFLRTLFLRTKNQHYCTLRSELLMSLHDKEDLGIHSIDDCHKFAWCLDACIRERFVDSKRARELQGFLEMVKHMPDHVLGDLSMILSDPHSIHTLSTSIIKNLVSCVNNESLPRHEDDLGLLVRLLGMGLQAWNMIDSRVFKEPKLEPTFLTKILPPIASLLADDLLLSISGKNIELEPISQFLLDTSREDPKTSVLLLHYLSYIMKQGWTSSVARATVILQTCHPEVLMNDTFLHQLVSDLCLLPENFNNPDFCSQIFDKFFLSLASEGNVMKHLLRLVCCCHSKVHPPSLEILTKTIQTRVENSPDLTLIYEQLMEKIQNSKQATPPPAIPQASSSTPEIMDTPLTPFPPN